MAVFATAEEVYERIGTLLEELVADEEVLARFRFADTVVQFQLCDPDATITVDVRREHEARVVCGECDLAPEVVMTMDADVAHRFWLGEVNVTIALARAQMRASGPVTKILALVPAVKHAFPRYRASVAAAGRGDLVGA